jgi:hypothetical protein
LSIKVESIRAQQRFQFSLKGQLLLVSKAMMAGRVYYTMEDHWNIIERYYKSRNGLEETSRPLGAATLEVVAVVVMVQRQHQALQEMVEQGEQGLQWKA